MVGRGHVQGTRIEQAGDPRRALARLVGYLRPYRPLLILVLVFVLAYTLLGLLEPYLIGRLIDQFISPVGWLDCGSWPPPAPICSTMLRPVRLDHGAVSQDALRRRRDLFEHLQRLSIAYFDRHTAGS
jgi:ATP-binding cassette subfamily B protein